MRRHVQLLALVLCVTAIAGASVKDVQSSLHATLQSKYDLLSKAFLRKDVTPYEHILSPDYQLHSIGLRSLNRKAVIVDLRRQMASNGDKSWKRTVLRLTQGGSQALVTVRGRFVTTFATSGKLRTIELTSLSKDTWQKRGSEWTLIRSDVLSVDAMVDGRPAGRS